ncbi:MAG: ABC transporter substrate-binding protein [Burkholderiaceae bacterium]|nr:MAG: ABC transporter substrate-binding protein [Burkholderiaceae bacterium]
MNRLLKSIVHIGLFGIGLGCSMDIFSAQAQQTERTLCPKQAIRFAHYEMGALYVKDRGGIDDDVLRELMKRSHCDFNVSVLPRARSWYELEEGNLDMLASGVPTPEREKFAWFAPYLADKKYVILGPTVPANITTMDAFIAHPKLMMGGVRSFKYSPMYDALVERLEATQRMEQVGDLDTLYRMFARGRFDATIASPLAYRYYLEKHPALGKLRFLDWDPSSKGVSGLALSKKTFSAKQAKQWQALMREMIKDGTVLQILTRHLGVDEGKLLLYSN